MFLQETDLNVVPGGIIPVMHVSQYDVGRELKFVLYSGYDYASLESGTTVTIEGTKPDGHGFQYSGVLDQNAHTATFVTTEQMTVLAGAIECKLTLYLNSQRIGTALFILDVEKAGINDSTIISDTELPLIIAQATEQMERAEAAAEAAALSETNAAVSEANAANSEIVCGSFMRMAGVSAASAEQSAIISGSFMRTAGNYADEAEASAASANVDALKSEGHALGTQNGTPVSSDSPYYHNNAKYWADEARQSSAGGVAASVIAKAEPTNISTHAYAIGDQFVYNGILYTATSAISVGATIIPGTNCSISDTITEQIGNAGHTILDEDGITYPQRSKLQFEGCEVTDDSTNDITKIKAEGGVTGVKGNSESTYRTGNVNLTPAHVGAVDEVEYEEDIYGVETPNPQSIQHQLTDQTNVLGAKNLLNITASTTTVNGVTFTVNTDKSITVNGTPTAIIDFVLNADVRNAIAQGDGFVLTGCPNGGASPTYGLKLDPASDKASKYDTGSGVQFDSNYFDYAEDGAIAVAIHIGSQQVGNAINKVFYPMLRLASDPDDTYVPYAMTNRELTESVGTLKTNLKATYNSTEIPFKFGIDASGNYGYIKAGADSVTPFKTGGSSEYLSIFVNNFYYDNANSWFIQVGCLYKQSSNTTPTYNSNFFSIYYRQSNSMPELSLTKLKLNAGNALYVGSNTGSIYPDMISVGFNPSSPITVTALEDVSFTVFSDSIPSGVGYPSGINYNTYTLTAGNSVQLKLNSTTIRRGACTPNIRLISGNKCCYPILTIFVN